MSIKKSYFKPGISNKHVKFEQENKLKKECSQYKSVFRDNRRSFQFENSKRIFRYLVPVLVTQ